MTTDAARPYHALSVIPDIDNLIIAGIMSGKTLRQLASEYDCSDVAILKRARQQPDYGIALEASLHNKLESREAELEIAGTADDQNCRIVKTLKDGSTLQMLDSRAANVSVARADRLLGHARWLAERSCPERWGQQRGQAAVAIQITINDGGTREVCIAQSSVPA